MVQRKVHNKLGIQADHVKSEKWVGNLKPASCQHQDGKNRGPDMKKKMKRSRSIKVSDFNSLKSSPMSKTFSQPGKAPPLHVPTTPDQKKPMIKTSDGSPNYMKSTSSSEARKERSQVSSFSLRRRNSSNSKLSSGSCNKPARTSTMTNGLKLVRTLTKSPSFKLVRMRGTPKKCSRVALCADMNIQKPTCSSTLKDSKFPDCLVLNPGGTEAEGTSAMKVCPYTYCSLNGHHHTSLPPLKCFLKARRRSLKTQKSMKLQVLSPRRAKLSSDGTEEIYNGLLDFFYDKPPPKEVDSTESIKIPLTQEVGMDFFIEIYAKNSKQDGADVPENSTEEVDAGATYFNVPEEQNDLCFFHGGDEVAAEQDNNIQVPESLSNTSSPSLIDFEENFEKYNSINPAEMNITRGFSEELKIEDVDAEYSPILHTEEALMESFDIGSEIEGECQASMEEDHNISEATDMEWEEGHFSAPDAEGDYMKESADASCIYLSEIKNLDWHKETDIIRSDDTASNCTEEILVDGVLQELFEEETSSVDRFCNDSDSEIDDAFQKWEITQVIGGSINDQLSSAEDAFEELAAMEERANEAETDLVGAMTTSSLIEEPIVESTAVSESIQEDGGGGDTENDIYEITPEFGDAKKDCTTDMSAETLYGHEEDSSVQQFKADDGNTVIENQISGSSQISDARGLEREFPNGEAVDGKEDEEQLTNAKFSSGIQMSDSYQSVSEADPHDAEINEDEKLKIPTSLDSEEQNDSRINKISSSGNIPGEEEKMELEACTKSDKEEAVLMANAGTSPGSECSFLHKKGNSFNQELPNACNNRKWTIRCKKPIKDLDEERKFNPREPNFLPVVPDPEAEKVDLKHQMIDDRKNSEEWMLDYALQQTVSKLAPARKRKVALLVEAFETVLPIPKYETNARPTAATFSHTRTLQACS